MANNKCTPREWKKFAKSITNKYCYEAPEPEDFTVNPELVIQHEHYTIRELLIKYTNGIMPPIGMQPQWAEDGEVTYDSPDYQTLENLDKSEQDQLLVSTKAHLKDLEDKRLKIKSASDTNTFQLNDEPNDEPET